jgi:hypothetical protein
MTTTLISLISDQTIPNVQFIKEKKVDKHIFITTKTMETKGVSDWIIKACQLENEKIHRIEVDAFSYDEIQKKTREKLNDDDRFIVNLTGGTKIMSLAVNDLLRNYNSEIYYLAGNKSYINIFNSHTQTNFKLTNNISLIEYLQACGFEIVKNSQPSFENCVAKKIYNYFLKKFDSDKDGQALYQLHSYRNKNVLLAEVPEIGNFISRIGFVSEHVGKLSKKETKYLTGDWFEEFIYFKLVDLGLFVKNEIGTGLHIIKNSITNEFDVMFIFNDILQVIECKTSIWLDIDQSKTIISETIYKADSLKNKFGLFAKTSIITLSDTLLPRLKSHIERASDNQINIFGREDLLNLDLTLKKLINAH